MTETEKSLGEQTVNRDAFELDLKINEGYQQYSAELLRLALLGITGLAVVWLRAYLPDTSTDNPKPTNALMAASFVFLAVSAASATIHRYTAADGLAHHLTALRRYKRNRPAGDSRPSDKTLADRQRKKRDVRFKVSDYLLRSAAIALILGITTFGAAMWTML